MNKLIIYLFPLLLMLFISATQKYLFENKREVAKNLTGKWEYKGSYTEKGFQKMDFPREFPSAYLHFKKNQKQYRDIVNPYPGWLKRVYKGNKLKGMYFTMSKDNINVYDTVIPIWRPKEKELRFIYYAKYDKGVFEITKLNKDTLILNDHHTPSHHLYVKQW